ncbi:MAG: hypothetical protein PHO74_00250 [Weeksellaceae bacterium]|nr:hypothetical protein [Weeksellaceae bacterium]
MKKLSYFLLGIGAFTFVACGGNKDADTVTEEPAATETTATETADDTACKYHRTRRQRPNAI